MIVLSCDPGTRESAFVLFDGTRVLTSAYLLNESVGHYLDSLLSPPARLLSPLQHDSIVFACEWVQNYGMTVGSDVLETCCWVGRFIERAERWSVPTARVTRRQVKLHLCGSMRAKDPNIRQALIDRFGGASIAKGSKMQPGPLRDISKHRWAALAVAVTYLDMGSSCAYTDNHQRGEVLQQTEDF